MAAIKTKQTDGSVMDFIEKVEDENKRKDCIETIKLMKSVTKKEPKMWGPSIIGFGSYHYKYESGHEGDMCIVGFSPRKANITLYVMMGLDEDLLKDLGKYKRSKGCLYINKLSDVNKNVLKKIISKSFEAVKKKYVEN